MNVFNGFASSPNQAPTPVPAAFFSELLPQIDHLAELKVTLYTIWFLFQQEGHIRFITEADFLDDELLMSGLAETPQSAQAALREGLERAVARGTLLRAFDAHQEPLYLLNTERGRATIKGLEKGAWSPDSIPHAHIHLTADRPNIFRLYEENIGALTPIIANALEDAEKTYPTQWIEDAFRIAVENNVRRWRYIEAILKSWQEEQRDGTNRRDSQENRQRYVQGKYGDIGDY
ncbi:MAG: DnaD domain protein [Chloroflexi bacterium]|nr:DnaD domain protein [Chloroflexota bacterium]